MISLTVDKVPLTTCDEAIDAWRKVIVLVGRPGTHPKNLHALRFLNGRQPTAHIRRQDRDLDARLRQATPHLVDVRLKTSHVGPVARGHSQHTQRTGLTWHSWTSLSSLYTPRCIASRARPGVANPLASLH